MAETHLSKMPQLNPFDQTLYGSPPSLPLTPPLRPVPEERPLSPPSPLRGETLDADDGGENSVLSCFDWPETLEDDPSTSSPHRSARKTLNLASLSSDIPEDASEETKQSLVGAGLANLGNTCFLNAVLQCFTHTVPLVEGLRTCGHKFPCDRDNEGFCVLCALREQIELSLASPRGVISPTRLVDNINYISLFFQRYYQEDAHEFLQCFLDKLDSCFLDSQPSQNNNLVKQVFGGRLISKLRCCNCNRCSNSYESIVDLSLEIKDVDTLPCALKSFTSVEQIGGPETKFTCENCNEEVSAEKQFMLDEAPSVATFHLKRFRNDGVHVEKIDKHVAYPLELDLQPYVNGSQNDNVDLKYKLYAVVVHVGNSSNSGHYFCFVRSSPDIWHRLDDSMVTWVREEFVLCQEAYILFYAKEGTPWFSSVMETQNVCVAPNTLSTSPKSVLDSLEGPSTVSPGANNVHTPVFNEVKYPADGSSAMSPKPIHVVVEVGKDQANTRSIRGPRLESGQCLDENSPSAKKVSDVSPSGKDVSNKRGNAKFRLLTPPRSPSPDIYSEEPEDDSFQISRDHLLGNQGSCKRTLSKSLEDSQRKAAFRVLKNMPASRSMKLMAAVVGSHSDDSLIKKSKRRMTSTPDGAPSCHARRKSCSSPVLRPVAARIFP